MCPWRPTGHALPLVRVAVLARSGRRIPAPESARVHRACRQARTCGSVFEDQRVKFDPVDEGVLVDRPRVRGAAAQGLAVGLAGSLDVCLGDCRERDKLDGVDFDQTGADPVVAALLGLRPLPQPDRLA
jgi:hypothetical protein